MHIHCASPSYAYSFTLFCASRVQWVKRLAKFVGIYLEWSLCMHNIVQNGIIISLRPLPLTKNNGHGFHFFAHYKVLLFHEFRKIEGIFIDRNRIEQSTGVPLVPLATFLIFIPVYHEPYSSSC